MRRSILKTNLIGVATLLLAGGCSTPTTEDIAQAEEARRDQIEYCQDLLKEMQRNEDRPLIRATIQETYNNDCLGVSYPTPGDG